MNYVFSGSAVQWNSFHCIWSSVIAFICLNNYYYNLICLLLDHKNLRVIVVYILYDYTFIILISHHC